MYAHVWPYRPQGPCERMKYALSHIVVLTMYAHVKAMRQLDVVIVIQRDTCTEVEMIFTEKQKTKSVVFLRTFVKTLCLNQIWPETEPK